MKRQWTERSGKPVNLHADSADLMPPTEMDALKKLKNIREIKELLKDEDTALLMDSQSSSTAPDMVSDGAGEKFKIINFYWMDMYEDPENPGVLFVFGKVKSPPPGTGYSSCCVVVKNIQRRILLLPRDKAGGTRATYMEMYNEFYSIICPKFKIQSFSSTPTTENDFFEIHQGTRPVAEYMEARYSGTMPELPQDLSGETFSHAFGTNTPLAEILKREKKLKGPCWLEILPCEQIQPAQQQQSWCKFEFTCPASSVAIHSDSSAFPSPTPSTFQE